MDVHKKYNTLKFMVLFVNIATEKETKFKRRGVFSQLLFFPDLKK